MDEIGAALATIDGLRSYSYAVQRVNPPAALVAWPEKIDYDQAMARGADSMTLIVLVLVGGVDARSSRDLLAGYLSGSGTSSVKAAIDGYSYIDLDSARVVSAKVDTVTVSDVDYLGAVFDVEIFGRGA